MTSPKKAATPALPASELLGVTRVADRELVGAEQGGAEASALHVDLRGGLDADAVASPRVELVDALGRGARSGR